MDIIIGTAKGGLSRIRDYYSRGRHTPLLDEQWGGRDDITAATGWERYNLEKFQKFSKRLKLLFS